jgi:hypothetical protein
MDVGGTFTASRSGYAVATDQATGRVSNQLPVQVVDAN